MSKNSLLLLTVCLLSMFAFTINAPGQTAPLPLGSITTLTSPQPCPTGMGWDTNDNMMCIDAEVVGCQNIQDLATFTFGYEAPSGTYLGTIVLFNGWSGTRPSETTTDVTFAQYYFGLGYEVVMLAWDAPWEQPSYSPPAGGDIQSSACRPATFLNYIYNNYFDDYNHKYVKCDHTIYIDLGD